MNAPLHVQPEEQTPEYGYHLLRASIEKFGKGVHELTNAELGETQEQADRTFALESRVLSSPEVQGVSIAQETVEQAVQELVARYPDREAFLQDLEANGITESTLHRALHRELLFDAVMQKQAAKVPPISDIDVDLFYQLHREQFDIPETRLARHILVTINNEFEQNRRSVARKRISDIRKQLVSDPDGFADLAIRHSECPTAMQGGVLGKVKQGMLYPELDRALFALKENEISDVVESEVGFHVVLCEKIEPARVMGLDEARDRIRRLLEERARRKYQKEWLATLKEDSK
jgi:peptidyl-prolyl cis-trans isomerase C